METEKIPKTAQELIESSKIAFLGSINDEGYPNIKAMLNIKTEGLKTIWFSTNTSSKRVSQFRKNSKACVYYVDDKKFMGLMLIGEIDVLQERAYREMLWKKGFERYYPLGMDDPDYTVLRFTTKWGNFYHGLSNINFEF